MGDASYGTSAAERRVDELGREAFERAVTAAATQATQNVSQIHRRRLVAHSASASFLVSLVIALVVSLALYHDEKANNLANAVTNCQLVKAMSAPLSNFVASDAKLRRQQLRLQIKDQKLAGVFQGLLGKSEYARLVRRSEAQDTATTTFWLDSVVPRLEGVAGANCAARLK